VETLLALKGEGRSEKLDKSARATATTKTMGENGLKIWTGHEKGLSRKKGGLKR